jgi:hypothetical protein
MITSPRIAKLTGMISSLRRCSSSSRRASYGRSLLRADITLKSAPLVELGPGCEAGLREDPKALQIYQSQYIGDTFLEGTHAITLTGLQSGQGNSSDQPRLTLNHSRGEKEPLFRWLCIE